MVVEKYYSPMATACQSKQHNKPPRHAATSRALRLHRVDLFALAALSPRPYF